MTTWRSTVLFALSFATLSCSNSSSTTTTAGSPPPDTKLGCPATIDAEPASQNFTIEYRARGGQSVTRHFLRERQENTRILLLVVDVFPNAASGHTDGQTVVWRGDFAPTQTDLLNAKIEELKQVHFSFTAGLSFTNNPIWPITRAWSEAEEALYNTWIHDHANADILVGSGIEVNCADLAITLRWIYAHDRGLPVSATLMGSGRVYGSWTSTTEWDALPTNSNWRRDSRFKAALKWVLQNSYTHTIIHDLYPVQITPSMVGAGSIFLTLDDDYGHTRVITGLGRERECDEATCFNQLYASVPPRERTYATDHYPWFVAKGEGGFLRFRWPEKSARGVWSVRAENLMPGFSEEQFQWEESYSAIFWAQLGIETTPEKRFIVKAQSVINTIKFRNQVTHRGYYLCSVFPCAPSSSLESEWSTPNRDASLAAQIRELISMTYDANDWYVRSMMVSLTRSISPALPLTYWDVVTSQHGGLSPVPQDDFRLRWGAPVGDASERLMTLASVAYENWKWRQELVSAKQDSTRRLDDAFRRSAQEFRATYASASTDAQESAARFLENAYTSVAYCPNSGCQSLCSMKTLLIDEPQHIEAMTSEPRDSDQARYGF